jgi:AraC family transcriptional regulator, transcriptional activator of the genes for pyochelin and ferripyochelin receptors
MQATNYTTLLNQGSLASRIAAHRAMHIEEIYRNGNGVLYRGRGREHRYTSEIVRLTADAILLATDCFDNAESRKNQIIEDGDWIHIQFRLNGGGHENCRQIGVVRTPAQSCIVARYPRQTLIERCISRSDRWRYVCLFMAPQALARLLDVFPTDLPQDVSWLADESAQEAPRIDVLPLHTAMTSAATDVLSCSYHGNARRAYMRAKSMELLSIVIHALTDRPTVDAACGEALSTADRTKLALARSIISEELASSWTLAELGRRVGLNRTKLACGFKHVYGIPVRQFWRDTNLDLARKMLQNGVSSVTEVAFRMGYSDTYSFTRAFTRKFGILPRECKSAQPDSRPEHD